MGIKIGSDTIGSIFVAGDKIGKIFIGQDEIYSAVQPLTLTAIEDTTVMLSHGTNRPPIVQYNLNGAGWQDYTYKTTLTLSAGQKVSWKGTNSYYGTSQYTYGYFVLGSGKVAASGNVNSLINFATTVPSYCFYQLFRNCASLVTAPELPGTSVGWYSYYYMFCGCSNLLSPPALPALDLSNASYCYYAMFDSCTSLTSMPELPATLLSNYCYTAMFQSCTSLFTTVELSAATVSDYSYSNMFAFCTSLKTTSRISAIRINSHGCEQMFYRCTSLSEVVELSASTISDYGYNRMFYGCTNLELVPALPATSLSLYCYCEMFRDCINLRAMPAILANTLDNQSCNAMFYNCTNLIVTPVIIANSLVGNCCKSMFYNCTSLTTTSELLGTPLYCSYMDMFNSCSSLQVNDSQSTEALHAWRLPQYGTFTSNVYTQARTFKYCAGIRNSSEGDLIISSGSYRTFYTQNMPVQFFTLAALEDTTITLTVVGALPTVQYNIDNSAWQDYTYGTQISLSAGQYIQWKGTNPYFGTSSANYGQFIFGSGLIKASGSIDSLINFSYSTSAYCYYRLFKGCSSLTSMPTLMATKLAESCYEEMFCDCTNLIYTAEIVASTMANKCCRWMFKNCTSLTTTTLFRATTLAEYCYEGMFYNCSSLVSAKELNVTTLQKGCYKSMFALCTSLTTMPIILASILAEECCSGMFLGCSALQTVVALSANTLAINCYHQMFKDCTVLQVSDSQTQSAMAVWRFPDTSVFTSGTTQTQMFTNCLGTRASDDLTCSQGQSCTYYTQNAPVKLFTLTAVENTTIKLNANGGTLPEIQYLLSGATAWLNYTYGTQLSLTAGQQIQFKGSSTKFSTRSVYGQFVFGSGKVAASGSINSLINFSSIVPYGCFYKLFESCTSLVTAPDLPATTVNMNSYERMFCYCTSLATMPNLPAISLNEKCYIQMFYGCTSLTHAIASLPATTLFNNCYQEMFNGCTSLTTAPALPATTVVNYCYYNMFYNCKALTTAPALPATTLAENCYDSMFASCTSLTAAPELPATAIKKSCYAYMFQGCTNLVVAPTLPNSGSSNTGVADSCYNCMFKGCTSLVNAPALDTSNLYQAPYCYKDMFNGCTSLTIAPDLPADTYIETQCYSGMFYGCTSLTTAPELICGNLSGASNCYSSMFSNCSSLVKAPVALPATTLSTGCYANMFSNCTSLTTIPVLPATALADNCYYRMFYGCTSLQINDSPTNLALHTFRIPSVGILSNTYAQSNMFTNCAGSRSSDSMSGQSGQSFIYYTQEKVTQFLTITAVEDTTVLLKWTGNIPPSNLAYSLNGTMWHTSYGGTGTLNLTAGQFISFRGCDTHFSKDSQNFAQFTFGSGKVLASGSVKSMIKNFKPDTRLVNNSYYRLFYGCSSLLTAPELPDESLNTGCYKEMFYGCTNLRTAPKLPATTLANHCYNSMFYGCTSLTEAPELPAQTLASYCYQAMFAGCTSLIFTPTLTSTQLATGCYYMLFYGCTSLTDAPELPAMTMLYECYSNMFWNCTNLVSPPALPATSLAQQCYKGLFKLCSKLLVAPVLPATTIPTGCYWEMFYNCTSLAEAPVLLATDINSYCYYNMFYGCTSLIKIPELPATYLQNYCYYGMFQGCTSLQISDTQTAEAPYVLRLPAANTFTVTYIQYSMFWHCAGTRSSDNMAGASGNSYTYYTQNLPTTVNVPLTLTALENTTVTLNKNGSGSLPAVKYRINGGMWSDYTYGNSISLSAAQKIQWQGSENSYSTTSNYGQFSFGSGRVAASGNVNSLANYSSSGVFYSLFYNCTTLVSAPELPSTNISTWAYFDMFRGCTSLVTIPNLPAEYIRTFCYNNMFRDCTSLQISDTQTAAAPCAWRLPSNNVYANTQSQSSMFTNCLGTRASDSMPGAKNQSYTYYTQNPPDLSWLTLTALENTTVQLNAMGTLPVVQYSLDDMIWNNYTYGTAINLSAGRSIRWRNISSTSFSTGDSDYGQFVFGSGKVRASGNCNSLINFSNVIIDYNCFKNLFSNCTSLITAPDLPATTLSNSCYQNMFSGCTNLISAPDLPANELKEFCYQNMYNGCTSLAKVGKIGNNSSNIILDNYCCQFMFNGCTSLVEAPKLSSTDSKYSCYSYMFAGCTSLLVAHDLPAKTLADNCYDGMFNGCSALVYPPLIYANILGNNSCYGMFWGCNSLQVSDSASVYALYSWKIPESGTLINTAEQSNMFVGCAGTRSSDNLAGIAGKSYQYFTQVKLNGTPLTLTAIEDTTVTLTQVGSNLPSIEYSTDSINWNSYVYDTSITLSTGQYVQFKGSELTFSLGTGNYGRFVLGSGRVAASGNVNSLINFSDHLTANCYYGLFSSCTSLVSAPDLPATALANSCYLSMFSRCTSLITPPTLPATTLSKDCYYNMFIGCTSLATPPVLPATKLAAYCYYYMLQGCTSLTVAPALPATTLAEGCYGHMLSFCSGLTTAPVLPALTQAKYSYWGLLRGCTGLTVAPVLPATTLAYGCYNAMFEGCTGLTTTPELLATTLAEQCYTDMFLNCTNLESATTLPATTISGSWNTCYDSMFEGCTSLVTPPVILATTLSQFCCCCMFKGCTSLTTPPELPATTLSRYCYDGMFYGCTSLTTPPALSATTLAEGCYCGMFRDCTSLQVSDTQTSAAPYAWRIPKLGILTGSTTYEQIMMFTNCLGTRSSDNLSGTIGQNYTYYTQTELGNNLDHIVINGSSTINCGDPSASQTYTVSYYDINNSEYIKESQKGVTWSIVGNATITQSGVITLNGASAGDILIITATSTYDSSINNTFTVTVTNTSYSINLNNGQWVDSGTTVSGAVVYKSDAGSYNINNGKSVAIITVTGYTSFTFYLRSYAESSYDYAEAFEADVTASRGSGKYTTSGKQSQTVYQTCTYSLDGGTHTIQIMYSKDGSVHSGDDRGYFYIPAQ